MKEPVRVLLLELPQLLRDILEHALQAHGGCELLGDTRRAFAMAFEPATAPDVVILGLTAAEDFSIVPALFARWPQAQVMTVTQAGNDAAVYELRPRRRSLGQMSPHEIVAALCDFVQRDRELAQ
jgi:DNA-binding NarL/FixJ family response regulator